MKYTSLIIAILLACAVSLTGCDRGSSQASGNTSDITLSLAEEEEEAEPAPEQQPQEDKNENNEKPTDPKPNDSEDKPQTEADSSAEKSTEKSVDEGKYAENLTEDSASANPNKLDTDLYSTFKKAMDENFDRKKGILNVYRLNADGTKGAYELTFDLTNAYDEEGRLNKKKEIEADMKIAETLKSAFTYGQGSREKYSTYDEYTEQLNWLRTPLLLEGFKPENISKLTKTTEDGSTLIEATFEPKAVNKLYEMDVVGVVTAYIQLDDDGNIEALGWEQTEIIDDYPTVVAESEYTFS